MFLKNFPVFHLVRYSGFDRDAWAERYMEQSIHTGYIYMKFNLVEQLTKKDD